MEGYNFKKDVEKTFDEFENDVCFLPASDALKNMLKEFADANGVQDGDRFVLQVASCLDCENLYKKNLYSIHPYFHGDEAGKKEPMSIMQFKTLLANDKFNNVLDKSIGKETRRKLIKFTSSFNEHAAEDDKFMQNLHKETLLIKKDIQKGYFSRF